MSTIDVTQCPTEELLKLHSAILQEMQQRGVLRTRNNIVGDYTEWLVADRLNLQLCPNSMKGYDATDADGLRYQIKGRRTSATNKSRKLGVLRDLDTEPFDVLVAVIFDENWAVLSAFRIPFQAAKDLSKPSAHQNGHLLHAWASLLNHPEVTDLRELLSGQGTTLKSAQ
ncbi:DUF6998 domain-containing protein [Castellaniella hirudinis]|uniref:DUF6998 domain-containing protein n=1 Tax=Castellaniella hirudinis TaxID=1144617 RepID=UPI0039C34BB2